jgi:hypothetical protein
MGGLVTILKVRHNLTNYDEDPGWYKHPAGTVASKANDEELRRDGIDLRRTPPGNGTPNSTIGNGHAGR